MRRMVSPSTARMYPSQSGKNVCSEYGAGPNQANHQEMIARASPAQSRNGASVVEAEDRLAGTR